jgi:hypothetical protein
MGSKKREERWMGVGGRSLDSTDSTCEDGKKKAFPGT